jgi:hypothetical protein
MIELRSLKRLRFFTGQLLTADDLALEQQYFLEKLKRHNRSLHGFGIVSGLKVTVNSGQIIVEPGLALDCEGNELVIPSAQSVVSPPSTDNSHTAFVNVRFVEERAELVPATETEETPTLIESFQLALVTENTNRGHRHLRARWLACGQPHALTIAKVRHGEQGWRVDRGYRPPAIK